MGLYTRTYADKSNTLVKCSPVNLSLNPLVELTYGETLSRGVIHFPHEKVAEMIARGYYTGTENLRHILHMTNSASVNERNMDICMPNAIDNGRKRRAVSYRLVVFLIPEEWDAGTGFDYNKDLYNEGGRGYSTDASNWYRRATYKDWEEPGVYSTDTLSAHLDTFTATGKDDIIIGYLRFENGNEPLSLDVTETFNKFITGELSNHGFGIAFSPMYEDADEPLTKYTAFFSGHTNSFFEPYIETTSSDSVSDDRLNFCNGRTNRLYFFAAAGGRPVDLDTTPTATIDGIPYDVKHGGMGAYYIEADGDAFEADAMYYDIWSGLSMNGHAIPDVEMEFVVKPHDGFLLTGKPTSASARDFEPYLYGIAHKERIRRGDIRKVTVDCKIPYTSDQLYTEDSVEFRLYTKNGNVGDVDIIPYTPSERAYDKNYFLVDTESLIPSRYYIDIKVRYGFEEIIHRDVLQFDIVGDETERFN